MLTSISVYGIYINIILILWIYEFIWCKLHRARKDLLDNRLKKEKTIF